jgi:hypothetical protein
MIKMTEHLNVKEASIWASEHTGKNVTPSNITYLVNYGRIPKLGDNGSILVSKKDLIEYYKAYKNSREYSWKDRLGEDLNWALSFDQYKEAETTKHVHRLHPYKGKFIPQLVEYFLDSHTDNFKREVFFKKGDIVLDPFCGSGTTLVQSNELGINAIGIDISAFNTLISNTKVQKVNLAELKHQSSQITLALREFVRDGKHIAFEEQLAEFLTEYNNQHFPSPAFKINVLKKEVDENKYASKHEAIVLKEFNHLTSKFDIQIKQNSKERFIEKWYLQPIREEIEFVFEQIKKVKDTNTRNILTVVLSRTIRSCRATTHADLATLVEPISTTYYCAKHGKICKPLFSILSWWERYCKDTFNRLATFASLRTNTFQVCLNGNSQTIDVFAELEKDNLELAKLAEKKRIKGIFSSPPYVGLIDYHEQHAYAYDLFGFERKDEQEIGAMFKKQSKQAQKDYATGISNVLTNCKRFLADDFNIFLVANDKYNLYPQIAESADLQIVNQYRRPVLNRTERDKQAYSEIIFHLKEK